MHGSWLDFIFAFVVTGFLVYVPGILISRALNIKGFLSIVVSPIITVGFITSLGVLFAFTNISWSVALFFASVFLLAIIFFGLRKVSEISNITRLSFVKYRKLKLDEITWKITILPTLIAVIVASIMLVRACISIKVPYALSQTYDANYHYNNVANMLETGNISSLHMLQLPPNTTFYPAAWHDLVVSVIHITGYSIPLVANAVTFFFLSIVWCLSILGFGLCVSKNKIFLSILALVSTLVNFFPALYFYFGMLYANTIASSFLPAVLLVVVAFLLRKKFFYWWQTLILGVFAFVALALSQPNTVFTVYYVVLVVLPFAGWYLGKSYDDLQGGFKRFIFSFLGLLSSLSIWAFVSLVSLKVQSLYLMKYTPSGVPVSYGRKEGVLNFIFNLAPLGPNNNIYEYLYNLPIAILVFVGVGVLLVKYRQHSWLLFAWGLFCFINFVAATWPDSYFRAFVSGVYYAEKLRLVPIQAVFMVIFISLAIMFIMTKLKLIYLRHNIHHLSYLGFIVLIGVFVAGNFVPAYSKEFSNIKEYYALHKTNDVEKSLFSEEELKFIEQTSKKLDKKYTIIGNPWKGATATWFLFGHKNVLYHTAYPSENSQLLIARELNKANENPNVCKAVKKHKLRYIYSFTGHCLWGRDCEAEYSGLENLEKNGVVKLLDQDNHGNKLYELTACDGK